MSRATLKPIVSKLREAIIKGIAGKLEKYGFDEEGKLAIEKPLSGYDETIRDNLISLFSAKKIDNQEKYIDYIHNTSRTFMHIIICFKLMEKRGIMASLLGRVIDTDIYSEIIPDFININPMAFDEFVEKYGDCIRQLSEKDENEEDIEYYQFIYLMEVLTHEMAQEVPLLFKEYEYNLIQPEYDDLRVILLLVSNIDNAEYMEDDFLGWIYQYWVDTEQNEVNTAEINKSISYDSSMYNYVIKNLSKEQTEFGEFYTPRWVIKHIVDNSLNYYFNQDNVEVKKIKLLDPACGAGNFLVYAFDALIGIYNKTYPEWSMQEKILSILKNNLFGADIQREPLQITALNLWIKAKSYAVNAKVSNMNLYNVNVLMANSLYPWENEEEFHQISLFEDVELLYERRYSSEDIGRLLSSRTEENHNSAVRFFKQEFDIVVMNPPFVDTRKMSAFMQEFMSEYYANNARNLFGAFIERAIGLLSKKGILGFVCSDTFLTLSSFNYVRDMLLEHSMLEACLLGNSVFDGPTVNSAILITSMKKNRNNEISVLSADDLTPLTKLKQKELEIIDGHPFIFDLSEGIRKILGKKNIGDYSDIFEVRKGIVTANNNKFLKYYWEVPSDRIGKDFIVYNRRHTEFLSDTVFVIDWRKNTIPEILKSKSSRCAYLIDNYEESVEKSSFREGVAFSLNGKFRCCLIEKNMVFDVDTPAVLMENKKYQKYMLAYLKSNLVLFIVKRINNSVSTTPGDVRRLPFVFPEETNLIAVNRIIDTIISLQESTLKFELISKYKDATPIKYGIMKGAKSLNESYQIYEEYMNDINNKYINLLNELNEVIYQIYMLKDVDKAIIEDKTEPYEELHVVKDINECCLMFVKEIIYADFLEKESKVYTLTEVTNRVISIIEALYGRKLVDEIEAATHKDFFSIIHDGIKFNGKNQKVYGEGFKDLSEPYIQGKIIGGKGKNAEILMWHNQKFMVEFQEDKKYALQNEIRRLTNDIYLPKLQRAKEKLQLETMSASEKKSLEKEVDLYQECVKTLKNWKVVD